MPATEQTLYDQKLLHTVFGFSALALLIATVWMFAADQNREWKGYQRRFREVEQRLLNWRKADAESVEQQATLASLRSQLLAVQAAVPPRHLVANFETEVLRDARERDEIDNGVLEQEVARVKAWHSGDPGADEGRFARLNTLYAAVEEQSGLADTARSAQAEAAQSVEAGHQALEEAFKQLQAVPAGDPAARQVAQDAVDAAESLLDDAENAESRTHDALVDAENEASHARDKFFKALSSLLEKARFREARLLSERKFRLADADAAKAQLDIGIRDGVPQERIDQLQAEVDKIVDGDGGVTSLTLAGQRATAHREALQRLFREMQGAESDLEKEIANVQAPVKRVVDTKIERRSTWFVSQFPFLGKRWLELPIINAFGSPLTADNLWTEGLERPNGSFGTVRRFDRCTTCHQAIAMTAPGSAVQPAFLPEQQLEVTLRTPSSAPVAQRGADGKMVEPTIEQVYGLTLAGRGLVNDDDVTVSQIAPGSAAASALAMMDAHGNPAADGLQVGDVILFVDGDQTLTPQAASQYLLVRQNWGQPVTLTIRRGLPEPFTSHPRLDLFVGSLSPHSKAKFGCTSCHEGQGSATDFKWASHTPDSMDQEAQWAQDHAWFHNHHWIFPMYPRRFAESTCLKCHHGVAELEPSQRFPDPPAPKVVEGWHLIGKYGCYGCHEINGFDGPDRRVGPDLRLEPNYYAAAAAVTADSAFDQLDANVKELATTLVQEPFRDEVRRTLRQFLIDDAQAEQPVLTKSSHEMAEVLLDQDAPGTRRKSGPSLRHIATKLGEPFAYDWIREPKNFRPTSKMPQFFGLWDHLHGNDREMAVDYERIEILGMVKYLMRSSQPLDLLEPEPGCEPGDPERGKVAFEVRGCLACHQHGDFPHVTSDQGPDLTHLGDKFSAESGAPDGPRWMYTWVKRPTHYHARTKMPDLYLDPVKTRDGKVVDPVADIVAYLLSSRRGWTPAAESTDHLVPNPEKLDALVTEHLVGTFPNRVAMAYLENGIPEQQASLLKGAEVELLGAMSDQKKLLYVGRKAIAKYGCYGCHDIPGFEGAKPIGAALAEWGRKESSKLAFEHIVEYLHHAHGGASGHAADHDAQDVAHADPAHADPAHAGEAEASRASIYGVEDPEDVKYFTNQIALHDRSGFLWQKLREPRSYDFAKTENKKYNDRLRMPLFPIHPEEREAIATFVLGLVADPPGEAFVYDPDPRQSALAKGLRVLEKYNCGGCHILEPEQWQIESPPGEIPFQMADSAPAPAFAAAHFGASELEASALPDPVRGVISTTVRGMPVISKKDGRVVLMDEEGDEAELEDMEDPSLAQYRFQLWEPVAFEGRAADVGGTLTVPVSRIKRRWPARGGDLTQWLLPTVVRLEKQSNSQANGDEAWGWVPPPLLGEGRKVQPDWLHSFLLEPYPIRPATFLRMPRFNMSPEEATALVEYFAARDGEEFPFEFDPRSLDQTVVRRQQEFEKLHPDASESRLDHGMKIVTNGNYCIKCHLVGNYAPESNERALAPDLAKVQERLRPTYLRKWITYPKHILPYTPMPINIPYDPESPTLGGVDQTLYPGSSVEQVDGLVDLLMNFSTFVEDKYDFSTLVEEAAGGAADGGATSGGEADGAADASEAADTSQPASDASPDNAANEATGGVSTQANTVSRPATDAVPVQHAVAGVALRSIGERPARGGAVAVKMSSASVAVPTGY